MELESLEASKTYSLPELKRIRALNRQNVDKRETDSCDFYVGPKVFAVGKLAESVKDESEKTNSGTPIGQKEDIKEPKKSDFTKKDIFRPYCLPDPDIKPFNSSYNVSILKTFLQSIVGIIVSNVW